MSWGRLDDGFDDHAKVLAILDEDDPMEAGLALGLWTLCFTWAHRNTRKKGKTPGLLPPHLPRRFFGPAGKVGAALLVKHGLWDEAEGGGWTIHDFDDYLPTEETRAARSAAGKRGAAKRWAGRKAEPENPAEIAENGNEPQDDGNLPEPDGTEPEPSHDADSKSTANDGSRAPARRAISKEIAPEPIPIPDVPSSATPQTAGEAVGPDAVEATPTQRAFGVARAWITHREAGNLPIVVTGKGDPLHMLRKLIEPFAAKGYDDGEIKHALNAINEGVPSTRQLERELTRRRSGQSSNGTSRNVGAPASPADDRLQKGLTLAAKLDADHANGAPMIEPRHPGRRR